MKEIRSFSLDPIVAKAVDSLPKNERSRKINTILKDTLVNNSKPEISVEQLQKVIENLVDCKQTNPVNNANVDPEQKEKAQKALNDILDIR